MIKNSFRNFFLGRRRSPLREKVKLRGNIDIIVKDKNGKIKAERHIHNVICNAGLGQVSGYINGVITGKDFTYIAIGTGTTSAAATDTALQAEITTGGGARKTGTASQQTTNVTNDTAQWVVTWTFTASFAVTESGILDASSAGNLLCHQVFSVINVVSGDQLTLTWQVVT